MSTNAYLICAVLCGSSNPKKWINLNICWIVHVQSYVGKALQMVFKVFSGGKCTLFLQDGFVVSLPNFLRKDFPDFRVLPSLTQPFLIPFSDILKHSSCNLVAERSCLRLKDR